jgi:hypothetical protein
MAFSNAAGAVTAYNPNFIDEGSPTTIVWGTDGILSGYICISARESTRVEEIDIMQGAGFTAICILLYDGNNVEITVIDDTAIVPPAIGQVTSLLNAFGAVINMLCINNDADQERKREGHRVLSFKSFNAIAGLHILIGFFLLVAAFFSQCA